MALVDHRLQRTSMLCAMYFAQGIPWGFMTIALIAYVAALGVSDAEVGKLTAIVLVPWTFKLVWAPLIDTMTIRSMGRRRPWIIGAELMMAVSLLGMLLLGDLTHDLQLLGWMFFIHNCFASLQDVSTDALAVDILPASEQGITNGLMWGSKLLGKAVGASAMAIVIAQWGISAAVLLQFLILMVIMLFPLLLVERPGDKRLPWSRRSTKDTVRATVVQAFAPSDPSHLSTAEPTGQGARLSTSAGSGSASSLRSPVEVTKDLSRAFGLVTTSIFCLYGTVQLIGWGIVEVITKTLYIKQLDWTFVEVAKVSGSLAVVAELIGALAGGLLADRFGRRLVMTIGFGSYGLLAIVFGSFPDLWDQRWFAVGYLILNPGVLAMGSVGFLSMSMRISWTKAAASMFTIYMTVSNVGHVIGNWMVGPLREGLQFSYEATFWTAGTLVLLPLVLLWVVKPERVDALRNQEMHDIQHSGH